MHSRWTDSYPLIMKGDQVTSYQEDRRMLDVFIGYGKIGEALFNRSPLLDQDGLIVLLVAFTGMIDRMFRGGCARVGAHAIG